MATGTSAVVLCGGTSSRMGGVDKTAAPLGPVTVLDHLLQSLPPTWRVTCVGAPRPTSRTVQWARESPPGGGPVAGIASALLGAGVTGAEASETADAAAAGVSTGITVVLGGDMPFAGPAAVELADRLATLSPDVDAVVASDGEGRSQPLLAAYRTLALVAAMPERPAGARLMAVVSALTTRAVTVDARAAFDVDTPEALRLARHMVEP